MRRCARARNGVFPPASGVQVAEPSQPAAELRVGIVCASVGALGDPAAADRRGAGALAVADSTRGMSKGKRKSENRTDRVAVPPRVHPRSPVR